MKKPRSDTVRIAEFKARLSEHLRAVRSGRTLTILDRETPVARVLPYGEGEEPLAVRRPLRRLGDVRLPPPLRRRVNSLAALLEERQGDR